MGRVTDKPSRLLLIEDNPGDARLILELIREAGKEAFLVDLADQLGSGLEVLDRGETELVLLDLTLPDSQGLDTLESVRSSVPKTPIVVLTGWNDPDTALQAVRGGAQDYLVKGEFDGSLLMRSIRYAIERKRGESRLKYALAESHHFRVALDNVPAYIYMKDTRSRYVYANKPTLELFGCSAEELVGSDDSRFFPAGAANRLREIDLRVFRGERTAEEIDVADAKGGRRVFWEVKTPIYDQPGSEAVWGLLGISTDITRRKQAEEEKARLEAQLQHAQKLESLGVMAGGIAHDFNNILMAVLGHAELAQGRIPPESAAHENLVEIIKASQRATGLCNQMLAYAGKASFALERVFLRELVEEMARLLSTAISKKAILHLNLERDLPPILADPSQVRQVLMNLIINASDAIGDRPGVINVSIGATQCDEEYLRRTDLYEPLAPGRYVYLEVTDTGCGMDAATRSRMFEPFFTTKFTGRGLGLAAVLGIVRAHKAALKVYSEPGKGTTFKILFPALPGEEGGILTPEPSTQADWRGKGTILLVDDEESLLALGSRMLNQLGFDVVTARDGMQALDLYRERGKGIDLVLMDLTMPRLDGAEAFAELRKIDPEVQVVLTSGYGREEVLSRFAGTRPSGFLQKPYTFGRLKESLSPLLPNRVGEE